MNHEHTTYKLIISNRNTRDAERAVLPAIMYASKAEVMVGYKIRATALTIGWWAWGLGIMRTTTRKAK